MKVIIIILLMIGGNSLRLYAQNECGTIESNPVFVSNQKSVFTSFTFKVYYHIIRKSNGNNPSANAADISVAHNILSTNFLSSNICFVWSGTDYIDNTDFYNYKASDESDLFNTNVHSDGIDVYIIRDRGKKNPYNGVANGIPGNRLIVVNSKFQESTFSHEMGHVLGLFHTFHSDICVENQDGSNSSICGDLVDDTPAQSENCAFITTNCQYPCSVNYDVTNLLNNFMTYSENLSCRTIFTLGQIDRMHNIINGTPDLQQRLVPENRTIAMQTIPYVPFSLIPTFTINEIVQEAKGTLTLQDVNIQPPGKGAFRAEQEIVVLPGFDALEGCRAILIIENICKANETQAKSIESVVEFYENEGFRIDISEEEFITSQNTNLLIANSESTLNVYPNPFSESFNISIETNKVYNESDLVSLSISDINGKLLLASLYTYNELTREIEINSSSLKNGIYILKIVIGDEVFISRVMKQ